MKKSAYILILLLVPVLLTAQKSYRSSWAKYIFADICLGAPIGFYEKYATEGDENSDRAVRWYKQGVRMANPELFERAELSKNLVRIVIKGSRHVINGSEVVLTTEHLYNEENVRQVLANLALGADIKGYLQQTSNPDMPEVLERLSDSVSVTNLHQMERRLINNQWTVVKKGTGIAFPGQCIKLDTDQDFYQADARYMFADMCLGAPVGFYREALRLSRDPNIAAALAMLDDSVKILNFWQFERRLYPENKCSIVFKGTDTRISGDYVQLSTDLLGDAEMRYKMVDIGLGAPIGFYQADAKNDSNIQMFSHFENGVKVLNLCDFERNRFSDLGMLDVLKGTRKQITGEEVILSSDLAFDEAPVRKIMACIALGDKQETLSTYPQTLWKAIALQRINDGVKIVNISSFEVVNQPAGDKTLVYRGTANAADGADILLNTDRYYNELKVRELLTMRLLDEKTDVSGEAPDIRETFRRLQAGVMVRNLENYQIKNGTLIYKNTDQKVNPEDIRISTDITEPVYQAKELMLKVELGMLKLSDLRKARTDVIAMEAYKNLVSGIKIINRASFEVKKLSGLGKTIVYKGTAKPVKAFDIFLSTDHEWSEAQARYIMADMALSNTVGFYEQCTKRGDPIAVEPYNRWMKEIRVTNASQFDRKFVPRLGWKIVYKGTFIIINPMDVKLSSDNK